MRSQKKIVVEIDAEGNCSIDGEGFVGTECSHFLREIEEALGQTITQTDKPEYQQRQTSQEKNLQRGGR